MSQTDFLVVGTETELGSSLSSSKLGILTGPDMEGFTSPCDLLMAVVVVLFVVVVGACVVSSGWSSIGISMLTETGAEVVGVLCCACPAVVVPDDVVVVAVDSPLSECIFSKMLSISASRPDSIVQLPVALTVPPACCCWTVNSAEFASN
uniref:Uncharacterized protein n=1 Tax=Glossina pallidipes TaxID=7398 RepID=A0A1A9Z3J6_GLOPL